MSVTKSNYKKLYYTDYSRSSLIREIAKTEQSITDENMNAMLKGLYFRRYMNLLDVLAKKLEEAM